jgi:hypothetical protein
VASTREGIEIFVINDTDDKVSVTKMPSLSDLVESLLQFGRFARTWFTSTH